MRRTAGHHGFSKALAALLLLALSLAACQPLEPSAMSDDPWKADDPMLAAVYHRKPDAVRRLLADGHPPDRSKDEQPLTLAASSDQFVIAELLLLAGADPWHVDRFGVGALEFLATSREPDATPDGQARLRIVRLLKDRRIAVPPPSRAGILELKREGRWPPRP